MTPLPLWLDRDLQLFHGTTLPAAQSILRHGVNVSFGKPDGDFGRGFYCTTSETQAREWSFIKAARSGQLAAIVSVLLPRRNLASLRSLVFVRADQSATDYWSFVHHCRKLPWNAAAEDAFAYDVVYGPVASPWTQLKAKPDSDQVSFRSMGAQRVLNADAKRSILEV